MRFLSKLLAPILTSLAIFVFAPVQAHAATAPTGRVILVLPFDNRSGDASLNWIGDSFPDTLDKRLNSAGFLTISRDDRVFALDHLGLPADFRPSRATTIRIAQQLDANYVIVGSYNIVQNSGNLAAQGNGTPVTTSTATPLKLGGATPAPAPTLASNPHIQIQAQILSVDNLNLSTALEDGADLNRLFDAENAVAWKLARFIDPNFNVAEGTFLAAPGAVPLPVFENYIRGTTAPAAAERIRRLKAAIALKPDFAAALLALGKEEYAARDYAASAETLARVPKEDHLALEANFYLGLARFNSANYAEAEKAFSFVAASLPLPEVVNNQGVALTRQGKDAAALFQRASDADPSDEDYHYNLAIALFRNGDTAGALAQCDAALKLKPNDNEVGSLRAHIASAPPRTKLTDDPAASFSPVTRVRRNFSETSFRQAAFQLDQLRAARMASLPPAERAAEYIQLGHDYLSQGLLPEAEQQFASALAADPHSAAAHVGLGQVREASNDPRQARDEATKSIALQPTAAAYILLARLDLAGNALPASADEVSHALKLEPSNTAALALKQNLQTRGQPVP
jgi:tetratricopeptide (TPR) repeat protein/TolB-like protein